MARDLKKELSQYQDLTREVRMLEDQLSRLQTRRKDINNNVKTDSVRGSMPTFPFVLHTISVKGLTDEEIGEKASIKQDIAKSRKRLTKQCAECAKEYDALTAFIANVEESEMRQILTWRYVYGYSWQTIAAQMGSDASEDSVRVAHDRFLKKF